MKYVVLLGLLLPSSISAGILPTSIKEVIAYEANLQRVPVKVLEAICWVESRHRPEAFNPDDEGSPSYGLCQVKESTVRDKSMGFKGPIKLLYNPLINTKYAAKYLRFQYDRYGEDWVKAITAYNAGHVLKGNTKYLNKVIKYLVTQGETLDE